MFGLFCSLSGWMQPTLAAKAEKVYSMFWMIRKIAYFCNAFNKKGNTTEDDSVAQLVEHIPFKDGVLGSNPS